MVAQEVAEDPQRNAERHEHEREPAHEAGGVEKWRRRAGRGDDQSARPAAATGDGSLLDDHCSTARGRRLEGCTGQVAEVRGNERKDARREARQQPRREGEEDADAADLEVHQYTRYSPYHTFAAQPPRIR